MCKFPCRRHRRRWSVCRNECVYYWMCPILEYIKWMTVVVSCCVLYIYDFFPTFIYFIFGLSIQFDCIIILFEGKLCACAFFAQSTTKTYSILRHLIVKLMWNYVTHDIPYRICSDQLVTLYYICVLITRNSNEKIINIFKQFCVKKITKFIFFFPNSE